MTKMAPSRAGTLFASARLFFTLSTSFRLTTVMDPAAFTPSASSFAAASRSLLSSAVVAFVYNKSSPSKPAIFFLLSRVVG